MDLSRVCSSCSRGTDEDIIFDLDHLSLFCGWLVLWYLIFCISLSLYISLVEVNQAIL